MASSDSLLLQLARQHALSFGGPIAPAYQPKVQKQKNLEKLFYDYNNTPEKRKARADYDKRNTPRAKPRVTDLAAGDSDPYLALAVGEMQDGVNPVGKDKTPAALRNVIDTTADVFGNAAWGIGDDTRRALGGDSPNRNDGSVTSAIRNAIPAPIRNAPSAVADLAYRTLVQAPLLGVETASRLADDATDATGINDTELAKSLPGKVAPGTAVMALLEALPDFGLHTGIKPRRPVEAPNSLRGIIPSEIANEPVVPLKTPPRPYETGLRERSVSLMASMPDTVLNTAKAEAVNRGRIPYEGYVEDIDAILDKRKPAPMSEPTPPDMTPGTFADMATEKGTEFIDSPEAIDFFNKNAPAIEQELSSRSNPTAPANDIALPPAETPPIVEDIFDTPEFNQPKMPANDEALSGIYKETLPLVDETIDGEGRQYPGATLRSQGTRAEAGVPEEFGQEPFYDAANDTPDVQSVREKGVSEPTDNVYRVTGPDGKVRHTMTAEAARREALDMSRDKNDDHFDAVSNHPEKTSGEYGDVKIEYGPAEDLMTGPYKGYSPPKDLRPQSVSRESDDGFTGSINTERLPGTPDAREAVVDAGKEGQIDKTYRSREDTIEASKAVTPEEVRAGIGDVSAKIKAGQNQTVDAAQKFVDTPVDSPDFDAAMAEFLDIGKAHSENVGETARSLEILRTPKVGPKGEVSVDAETLKKFHEFVKDPANADKLKELLGRYKDEPDTIKKIVRAIHKPGFEDYIASTWFNMVLSGPITHARNILGNTMNLAGDIAGTKGFASIIGQRRRLYKNTDRVYGREVAARLYGSALGAVQGFKNMGKAFGEGVPLDLIGKVENPRVFNGPLSVIEAPTKALAAEDEFFRSVAHMSELYGLATRKVITEEGFMDWEKIQALVDDPPVDMLKKASDYSQVMRFQDEPGIFAKLVQGMSHPKKGETIPQRTARLGFRLTVAPFVRTPSSIIRTAIRNSPLGILESRNIRDWKAGGADRDMAIARVAVGTSLMAIIVNKVMSGDISGDGPTDWRKTADKQAAGWRPKSIKVGDKWYTYDNLGPLSALIASTANSVEREKELGGKDASFSDKMAASAIGVGDGLVENGWMESVSNVMKVLTAPAGQRKAAVNNLVASEVSSMTVPAILRQINQTYLDTKIRDATGDGSLGDAVKGRVMSGIPTLSNKLPQKMDTFGNPINREGSFGLDILNPLTSSSIKADSTVKELDRLGESDPEGKALIGPPSKTIKIAGNQVKLSAREFQDYQTVSGQYITKSLSELMASPAYKTLSDDERRSMVGEIKKDARKFAREQLFTPTEADPKKTPTKPETPVADAFPGIPTSIRRTKAGNEAVGGVANSDHLAGDAIDFIPPKGTSMKALEEQAVKFFGPDVRILNEGTHLHVHIPGLNGPLFGTRGAR